MSEKLTKTELKKRREIYILQRVEGVKNKSKIIQKLSEELFISTDTIYKVLRDCQFRDFSHVK